MANPLKMLKLKPVSFQFILETPIKAPPKKVWSTLLNPGKWFLFDLTQGPWPKSKFEPWPGGRWTMQYPDGTHDLAAFVTRIEPQKLLRLAGHMGQSHVPVNSAFIFELQPKDNGKSTLLRIGQRTFGFTTPDLKKRMTQGWTKLLGQLKARAEK
jgi:uncharacterized protein YndB with AHSA1/START domain